MSRKSTAMKVKDMTRGAGEISLFELSKQVKKGAIGTKFVIIHRFKPISGTINTTVWFSNQRGEITFVEPIAEYNTDSMTEALNQFGYNLV